MISFKIYRQLRPKGAANESLFFDKYVKCLDSFPIHAQSIPTSLTNPLQKKTNPGEDNEEWLIDFVSLKFFVYLIFFIFQGDTASSSARK